MKVKLVNDATALLSMRESDFDAYSAFGEVVDNSIQAGSKNIRIKFMTVPAIKEKKSYLIVKSIAFGDDGEGMNSDILHQCLQLGYSSRYNDRSGIGRFGVGVTLGAINQCKRFEVYSKENGNGGLHTYIDIDEITTTPPMMEDIPKPEQCEVPKEYKKLVGKESGTLIVWRKYDRQPVSADELIANTKIWIGRTYRKFIWDGLKVEIDGEEVKPIDPLYVTTKMTKFPDDKPALEYSSITLPWPIAEEDRQNLNGEESDIKIRMSLLDESLRGYRGVGGSKESKNRCIHENEGVSILRNNREVFYGPIPYWKPEFLDIDRWWGCEISFKAELDKAFLVKNIKRGAVPTKDLKDAINSKIVPTIKTCRNKVSEYWDKVEQNKKEEKLAELNKDGLATGHEDVEEIAKNTPTDKSEIDRNKNLSEEAKKIVETIKQEEDEEQKALWATKFESQPFTIIDGNWKGPNFFDIDHLGGADIISYNTRHLFFEVLEEIINSIQEGDKEGAIQRAVDLKNIIDILIISYSKSEASFDPDLKWKVEDFLEDLKLHWGNYLKNYLNTWKNKNE